MTHRTHTPAELDAITALEAEDHMNPQPPIARCGCVTITDDWTVVRRPCDTHRKKDAA